MKLKRIAAAMLAAVLMTSTAVYAEDISTENEYDINIDVENPKDTFTMSDSDFQALAEHLELSWYQNDEGTVFDENSVFVLSDGKYSVNNITGITGIFIDVQKDADGNTTFKTLDSYHEVFSVGGFRSFWYYHAGQTEFSPKMSASEIISSNATRIDSYNSFNSSMDPDFDNLLTYSFDDVDILMISITTNSLYDNQNRILPETNGEEGGISYFFFTEQGADTLKASNDTTDTETDEAPATSGYVNDLIAVIPEDTAVTMKTAVAEGVYSQRFVQKVSVDELEGASKAEFTLSNGTDTVKRSTNKCYSSLYVNGSIQQAGEGYVFLCFTVKDIPEDMQLTVESIEII